MRHITYKKDPGLNPPEKEYDSHGVILLEITSQSGQTPALGQPCDDCTYHP